MQNRAVITDPVFGGAVRTVQEKKNQVLFNIDLYFCSNSYKTYMKKNVQNFK